MATLLLSTVGTAVGGPVGGLIGAVAGKIFDNQVLGIGNRRVEGPRQDNLAVQSGSYGGSIPLLFGTGRYAGNVIWSTGLVETREEERQGGKGGPSVTSVRYAYSASFAVGICLGPIQAIGRIWADGKLIRSAGEELSVGGMLRVYAGDDDQAPDPFVEGEIGVDAAPGFRGLAYCVFEALPLAEFGNRIPNLTFEVIRHVDPSVGSIAQDLIEAADVRLDNGYTGTQSVGGFQISGTQSYRDALTVLTDLFPLQIAADQDGVVLSSPQTTAQATVSQGALGARAADNAPRGRMSMDFDHSLDLPAEVRINFANPATDFQSAVQSAQKARAGGSGALSINTAMTLGAPQARAMAVTTLSKLRDERRVVSFDIGLEGSALDPGDVIAVDHAGLGQDVFEIVQTTQSSLVTSVTARSLSRLVIADTGALPDYSGEVSYTQSAAPPQIGADVFELPATAQFGADPAIYAAVSRLGGRIKSAGLYVSRDAGVNYDFAAQVPVAAVTGVSLTGLEDRNAALFDQSSRLDVQLDHPEMALSARPLLALLNGANLALVGGELMQFRHADLLESGAYRLTGLLRGRGGTENDQMGSAPGQRFILLQSGDLASQAVSVSDLGTGADFKIVPPGLSLANAPAQSVTFAGEALVPLSPAHLMAHYDSGTGLSVTWVRRSRTGFGWIDGTDAPLGEASLAFRVTYTDGAAALERDVTTAADSLTPSQLSSTFGAGPTDLTITVAQISDVVGAGAASNTSITVP